jgi:hypothetical protein
MAPTKTQSKFPVDLLIKPSLEARRSIPRFDNCRKQATGSSDEDEFDFWEELL